MVIFQKMNSADDPGSLPVKGRLPTASKRIPKRVGIRKKVESDSETQKSESPENQAQTNEDQSQTNATNSHEETITSQEQNKPRRFARTGKTRSLLLEEEQHQALQETMVTRVTGEWDQTERTEPSQLPWGRVLIPATIISAILIVVLASMAKKEESPDISTDPPSPELPTNMDFPQEVKDKMLVEVKELLERGTTFKAWRDWLPFVLHPEKTEALMDALSLTCEYERGLFRADHVFWQPMMGKPSVTAINRPTQKFPKLTLTFFYDEEGQLRFDWPAAMGINPISLAEFVNDETMIVSPLLRVTVSESEFVLPNVMSSTYRNFTATSYLEPRVLLTIFIPKGSPAFDTIKRQIALYSGEEMQVKIRKVSDEMTYGENRVLELVPPIIPGWIDPADHITP